MKKKKKRIYFVAALVAKDEHGWAYKKIAEYFREMGYSVWDDVNKVDWEDAQDFTEREITKYHTKTLERIRQADIFVAEISQPSSSVGYEVGYAVSRLKPVLVFRSDKRKSKLGAPFRGNKSRMTVVRYNKENLKKKVGEIDRKVERGLFTKRAVMRFTPEEIEYIEFLKMTGVKMSFNSIVRDVIRRAASKDKKYRGC